MRTIRLFWPALILSAGIQSAPAFALLGRFTPWMTAQLSYQDGFSIGGPMNLGEGYRWNVPVLNYAYDASFLDFFGSNGVAAVDGAMQILNNLPAASAINPTNYPLNTTLTNTQAQALGLIDLKSAALSLVLEQMGLAQPTRSAFTLRGFINDSNYTVIMRNFDPLTFAPSASVNGTAYTYQVVYSTNDNTADAVEVAPNPLAPTYTAVADRFDSHFNPVGAFYTDLTYDDVGGLRYLLNPNQFAVESLLPGVTGTGTNAGNFVNRVLRPGVDKVTFVRHDFDSLLGPVYGPVTNDYVDSYVSNNMIYHQTLRRVATQPDILFTASDAGLNVVTRTGTSNWVNNGSPGLDGPGVIQAAIVINFNRLGPSLKHCGSNYPGTNDCPVFGIWGSFDATTNAPVIYPAGSSPANSTEFHLWLAGPARQSGPQKSFSWNLSGQPNTVFLLQTATNMSDWHNFATITNLGGTFTFEDFVATNTVQRFYRTVPQ